MGSRQKLCDPSLTYVIPDRLGDEQLLTKAYANNTYLYLYTTLTLSVLSFMTSHCQSYTKTYKIRLSHVEPSVTLGNGDEWKSAQWSIRL